MSSPPPPSAAGGGPSGRLRRLAQDQRTAFLLVGAVNTGVGYLAFLGFDSAFTALAPGMGGVVHNTVVLACAHVVSVLVAFVLYRRLVFKVSGHVWRDLARFESVYLTSLAVNWVLLNLLVEVGQLTPKVAQTLIVAVTAVLSWFGHKHFSFRRHRVPR